MAAAHDILIYANSINLRPKHAAYVLQNLTLSTGVAIDSFHETLSISVKHRFTPKICSVAIGREFKLPHEGFQVFHLYSQPSRSRLSQEKR